MKQIAIVGTGYWGKNLVRNHHRLGSLKVVCDTNPNALKAMKESYPDVGAISDFDGILEDPDIKGIVVALPAERHFEFAHKALEAGKDVYVEKPLALRLDHAQRLIELAKAKSRILMVGHILRYHPVFLKLMELVEQGELGRIQYIYSNRLSLGKIRREENALWSFAPHDISMILALCGEVPEKVSATGSTYLHKSIADVTMTQMSFPSGINSHIFVSWLHPFKDQKLIVVADKKMAVFEDTQPWDSKLRLYPHHIKWEKGIPIPEKAEAENVPLEEREPLLSECKHFLECMEMRKAPRTDGEEGFRVLKILDLAQRSLEAGGAVLSAVGTSAKTKDYFVHESAVVDEPCQIGKGTKIWHFAHVMKGAKIGERCILGQNVNVDGGAVIGNNVKIQNNVAVYTGAQIEDDVFLGPSCVLTNVTNPRSQVNRHSLYEKTVIRRGATVGANATIVCGITLGRYSFVGAGSVVTKDVPDYSLVVGNPARQIGWMSRHGVCLKKFDKKGVTVCPESGFRYKKNGKSLKCLDLDEEAALPTEMAVGKRRYDEYKSVEDRRKSDKKGK